MLDSTLYLAASMPYCSILLAQYEDIGATQVLYTSSAYIHFCVELFATGRKGLVLLGTGSILNEGPGKFDSVDVFSSSDVWNLWR